MGFINLFLTLLIQAVSTLLLLYCILSWFVPPDSQIRIWVGSIVDPLLNPIRRVMPDMGMMDFSPIVLMLLLQFIARLLSRM